MQVTDKGNLRDREPKTTGGTLSADSVLSKRELFYEKRADAIQSQWGKEKRQFHFSGTVKLNLACKIEVGQAKKSTGRMPRH